MHSKKRTKCPVVKFEVCSMKKIIALLAVITMSFMVCAQEFPKGILAVQPSTVWQSESTVRICISWLDKNYTDNSAPVNLYADFNVSGDVIGLIFSGYQYPTTNKAEMFKNLESWKKFAKKSYDGIVIFPGQIYLEKTPYVFLGNSIVSSHFEAAYHSLIFKKGERLLSIESQNLMSGGLKVGESYIIGRQGNDGENYFTATLQKDGTYDFSQEMKAHLAIEEKWAKLKIGKN